MLSPLWQHNLGTGVIDCDCDPETRIVVAGDVNGYATCLSYENGILWEDQYSMPIWGASVFTKADDSPRFAFALARKTSPQAGELVVTSSTGEIYRKKFEHPAWDTAFLQSGSWVAVTTWEGELFVIDLSTGRTCLDYKSQGSLFGLAREDSTLYATESGRGLLCLSATETIGGNALIRALKICYNVCLTPEKILTGSMDSNLYVIDRQSRQVKAVNRYGSNICSVAVCKGFCYTGDFDGNLLISPLTNLEATVHAEQLPDTIWNIAVDEKNDRVFVACGDGNLLCFQIDMPVVNSILSINHEAARSSLQSKIETNAFDVFLCHNSKDKPEVMRVGERLKERGILPWLDEWELRPGLPWQRLLEEQIEQIKSAAVFVGEDGIGPWQQMELEAFLREFVHRGRPVIPVLLPDAPKEPKLPLFLKGMTWVDFRKWDPDPMDRLIWGITGKRSSGR